MAIANYAASDSLVVTSRTLVWQDTKFAFRPVFLVTDISATVAPIGVQFCRIVHFGPGQLFSLFGAVPPGDPPNPKVLGLKFGHLTANISKTVRRTVTCQLDY